MKATNATVIQRVEEVLKIRLLGAEFHDIREYAVEKQWNVSDTQLRRYIEKSDELLLDYIEKRRDRLMARHLAQRRALYARAMETGDLRTALAVVKDEAELQALYDTEADSRLTALEQAMRELRLREKGNGSGAAQAAGGTGSGNPPADPDRPSDPGSAAPRSEPGNGIGGDDPGPVAGGVIAIE
jgi:hypothetical protein